MIASVAVAILGDLVTSDSELDTDEELQEFCGMALVDDLFIYSNTDSDDPEVVFLFLHVQYTNMSLQKYTGLFHSPLIVRTFAAQFSAIQGAIKVPVLRDANLPEKYPCGGLALSTAAVGFSLLWYYSILMFACYEQMACALTLCKTEIITVEMIWVSKESGNPVMFTKTINKASGKESYKETAFSFAT
jgi:hypothetical protein